MTAATAPTTKSYAALECRLCDAANLVQATQLVAREMAQDPVLRECRRIASAERPLVWRMRWKKF